jgi:hypothetical protein
MSKDEISDEQFLFNPNDVCSFYVWSNKDTKKLKGIELIDAKGGLVLG